MLNLQSKIINGHKIQYIFKPNRKDHAHLVVLFNGYRHRGWDFENSINFFKCSILMIDDFFEGFKSCYLGKNGTLDFADSVNSLIDNTLNTLDLSKSQCTLIGASKGGFAALYIGIKYNFTNIVASSFVGYIGKWMVNYNNELAKHVMGDYSNEVVKRYDNILIELIDKDKNSTRNIYTFLSNNDYYYLEYGQKDIIKVLGNKYSNFNVFFTKSPLSFQHDQVATYFLQEILSVTNLLTQNIAVKLEQGMLDDIYLKVLHIPNDKTEKLLVKRKENLLPKVVPHNEIHTIKIVDHTLFIEGLAYLEGYDAPDYSKLHKYLAIENIHGNFKKEFILGSVPKREQNRLLYNNVFYDYTASGFATKDFKGINLSSLEEGTYRLTISVSDRKDLNHFYDLKLKNDVSNNELDIKNITQGVEYRIFSITRKSNSQIFITKRPIINELINFYRYFNLENYWAKDFKFHLEGVFIVVGVNIYKFNIGRYYLVLRCKKTKYIYSCELGQVLKSNLSEKIGNSYGGYEACYFASMGFKGVDVKSLPEGDYDVLVSLSYQNEIFTECVNGFLRITKDGCFFYRY
ncbi:hypothetical protein [Avibacterium avium]|uniref:hypothetical protein n=1 Tax=Avibacterium avium TaxID=751 RepID=UPI003BF794F8